MAPDADAARRQCPEFDTFTTVNYNRGEPVVAIWRIYEKIVKLQSLPAVIARSVATWQSW